MVITGVVSANNPQTPAFPGQQKAARGQDSKYAGELIRVENLTKTYFMGDMRVDALRGVSLTIDTRQLRRHHGPVGLG